MLSIDLELEYVSCEVFPIRGFSLIGSSEVIPSRVGSSTNKFCFVDCSMNTSGGHDVVDDMKTFRLPLAFRLVLFQCRFVTL